MRLSNQRATSAKILRIGKGKVWFDNTKLDEVKDAITRYDLVKLIRRHVIQKLPKSGGSRVRARHRQIQRRKGRQQGSGTRKGSQGARLPQKSMWMAAIRTQRMFLKTLREKELITSHTYRSVYLKAKGGAFRNKRHLKLYLTEQKLFGTKK